MAMDLIKEKAKSSAKKMSRRTGEKLLRKMGGGETRDHQFDDIEYSFQQQVMQSGKLRKFLKMYLDLVKEMRKAIKNVNDVIADFYEDGWPRSEEFQICLQDQEQLWTNFEKQIYGLRDPIRRYELQFQDAEERIEQRKNKLLDYDFSRRQLEKLYNDNKASDDDIAEAEDDFDDKEHEYQQRNQDLIKDLSTIIQGRIGFMNECFMKMISAHQVFFSESLAVQNMTADIMGGLPHMHVQVTVGKPGRGQRRGQGMRDTRPGGQRIPAPGQRAYGAAPSQYGPAPPHMMQQAHAGGGRGAFPSPPGGFAGPGPAHHPTAPPNQQQMHPGQGPHAPHQPAQMPPQLGQRQHPAPHHHGQQHQPQGVHPPGTQPHGAHPPGSQPHGAHPPGTQPHGAHSPGSQPHGAHPPGPQPHGTHHPGGQPHGVHLPGGQTQGHPPTSQPHGAHPPPAMHPPGGQPPPPPGMLAHRGSISQRHGPPHGASPQTHPAQHGHTPPAPPPPSSGGPGQLTQAPPPPPPQQGGTPSAPPPPPAFLAKLP